MLNNASYYMLVQHVWRLNASNTFVLAYNKLCKSRHEYLRNTEHLLKVKNKVNYILSQTLKWFSLSKNFVFQNSQNLVNCTA